MNTNEKVENEFDSAEYELSNEEVFSNIIVKPEPCLISKSINSCISQCC